MSKKSIIPFLFLLFIIDKSVDYHVTIAIGSAHNKKKTELLAVMNVDIQKNYFLLSFPR